MIRTWAMAGLTGDINLRPSRGKGICGHRVVFFQPSGMALGTASIPVEVGTGPVKAIAWAAYVIGYQLVPALPALLFWTAIPSRRQSLHAPIIKLD